MMPAKFSVPRVPEAAGGDAPENSKLQTPNSNSWLREWTGPLPEPTRIQSGGGQSMPVNGKPMNMKMNIRKPGGHTGH